MTPKLCCDILTEIIIRLNASPDKEGNIKVLQKFMQSGKEPFEAVLKYFSQVDSVVVHDDHLTVFVKRVIFEDEFIIDAYLINYNFVYLNAILKVMSKSNEALVIEHYPNVQKGKRALAFLTQKDLKTITFSNYNVLKPGYYKFFKEECQFDKTYLFLNGVTQTTLEQYFSIPSFQYIICTYMNASFFEDYIETSFCDTWAKWSAFNDIKNLTILQCAYFVSESITYPEDVYKYFSFFAKCFPNLEYLEVHFDTTSTVKDKWNLLPWLDVYSRMTKFNPKGFETISPKIKGSLNFYVYENDEHFCNALKELPKDQKVDVNNDEKILIKKFDIHDGLTFQFKLQFKE